MPHSYASSYKVLVDWNNDGDYEDTYDDITSDVLSLSWVRGRDYASQLTGRSSAGKLQAVLINTDGKYSPSNTSSVLTGSILPGRPVRLNMGSGEFPYTFPLVFDSTPQWVGFLQEIKPDPSSKDIKTCKLTAYGSLGYLNDFAPSLETQTDRRTDQAIGDILDDVGWGAGDRELATGQTTMTRFWVDGPQTIKALRIVEETEAGFIKETKEGKIAFESRHTRLGSPYDTSQVTFSDASDADYTYMKIAQQDPLSTITNHLEATARTYATAGAANLWTHPETGSDSPTLVPGESKTFEALYPNPSAGNNALEVNAWTTPAATTDYLANTASDGSGTNRTSDIAVTQSKTAERMTMGFTNGHATDTVYMTKIAARGTAVSSNNPVQVRSLDATSQAAYGQRKYKAQTEFLPSSTEAQSWCDYQLSIYASPIEILTMTFSANVSHENLAQSLLRDISDRITIVANNNAKLGISADFFIETEQHSTSPGGMHFVTWHLSPATGGYSAFWVLDKGKLGISTVPAY